MHDHFVLDYSCIVVVTLVSCSYYLRNCPLFRALQLSEILSERKDLPGFHEALLRCTSRDRHASSQVANCTSSLQKVSLGQLFVFNALHCRTIPSCCTKASTHDLGCYLGEPWRNSYKIHFWSQRDLFTLQSPRRRGEQWQVAEGGRVYCRTRINAHRLKVGDVGSHWREPEVSKSGATSTSLGQQILSPQ